MFAFVSRALISTGRELATIPAHYAQRDLAWQQDVCARMIDAYRTFAIAAQALDRAHQEVAALAGRATVPTKVVMSRRLAVLRRALERFGDCVVAAYGLQRQQSAFLQNDLLVEVAGPKSLWFTPPRSVHLYALTCPESVSDAARRSGYHIRYPTVYPASHLVDGDRYRQHGPPLLPELTAQIAADLQERLGYAVVDIRDADGLAGALQQYPCDLDLVQEVRQQLAHAIAEAYPLDRLLR